MSHPFFFLCPALPSTVSRHLELSHNKMTHIEADTFKPLHYSLEVLKLDNNQLTKDVFLPLQNLRNLRHLVVSGNNITSVPAGSFHKHGFLAHLELSDNRVSELGRGALKGTEKYLQVLKLGGNPLTTIHNGTFQDHTRLQELNLDSTSVGGALYEDTFRGASATLRKLSISGSNLTTLDLLALQGLGALEDLDLSKNFITDIPEGVFQRLRHLVKLDLSQNALQELPDAAFRGLEASLESIDFHDNYLQTITRCVFDGFQRLGELRLRDNPLTCDCRFAWLHNWVQLTLPEYHRSLLEWRCTQPQELSRRLFGTLFMADLHCPNNSVQGLTPACNFTAPSQPYVFQVGILHSYIL